jgi:hypothetical protein
MIFPRRPLAIATLAVFAGRRNRGREDRLDQIGWSLAALLLRQLVWSRSLSSRRTAAAGLCSALPSLGMQPSHLRPLSAFSSTRRFTGWCSACSFNSSRNNSPLNTGLAFLRMTAVVIAAQYHLREDRGGTGRAPADDRRSRYFCARLYLPARIARRHILLAHPVAASGD